MKTRIPKSFLGASLAIHLLSVKVEAATLPLAQIPTNVKTGFQYGLGLLFMIGFPKVHEYYMGLSKEDLVRKAILGKVQRSEYSNQRNQEIVSWVEEHPEVKARIEERIKNIPADRRERAFVTMARSEAVKETVKASQGQGIRA